MDQSGNMNVIKSCLKQDKSGNHLPPLSSTNIFSTGSAKASVKSPRIRSSLSVNSQRSIRSSLSSRTSSSGVSSAGSEALEERSLLSRSIDSETLAIAVELRKLKERREKDEHETFARIMDVSDTLESTLKSGTRLQTPRPKSIVTNPQSATTTPPPTRVYSGPGAHFLNWYIPKHIAGSRALQRTKSGSRKGIICSPLHKPDKQEWMEKLIDPKASGLRIPTAVPPRIIDYPCLWENNLQDELKKYQLKVDPSSYIQSQGHASSLSNVKPNTPTLKSLLLTKPKRESPKEAYIDRSDVKLNGSMFTKAHAAPMPWFVVHPDWRNEPKIRRTWENLEATKEETEEHEIQ